MKRVLSVIMFTVLLISGTASPSFAAMGYYLGVDLLGNVVLGDFDGVDAPDVDPGGGFGLVIGYGLTPFSAIELNGNVTQHEVQVISGGPVFDATYSGLTLSLKFNLMPDHVHQPFVRLGGGYYLLTIDDPVLSSSTRLSGMGGEVGLGMDYYLFTNFSIGLGVTQRFIRYDKSTRLGQSTTISPSLVGDTTSANINFVYHFGPGYGDLGGF